MSVPSSRLRAVDLRLATRVSLALLLAGSACGGDSTAPECTAVDVSLSTSVPPLITWRPNCGVARLSATSQVSARLFWAISAGDRPIESGVRYGEAPLGTIEHSTPHYLFSGTQIVIQLESPLETTVGSTIWVVP